MERNRSVDKGLDILEAVAECSTGLGVRSIAQRAGITPTSAHNIARTLVERGYLRQDPQTRHYALGLRAMMLGQQAEYSSMLTDAARTSLLELSEDLKETVLLAALRRHHVIRLEYLPSNQALRVEEPEDLNPIAHCTGCGKVLLAAMHPADRDYYFRVTPLQAYSPKTITDPDLLMKDLARINKRGYAQVDGEMSEGIFALAVPIRDPWGNIMAALGVSIPTIRASEDFQARILERLKETAHQIALAWGTGEPRPASA